MDTQPGSPAPTLAELSLRLRAVFEESNREWEARQRELREEEAREREHQQRDPTGYALAAELREAQRQHDYYAELDAAELRRVQEPIITPAQARYKRPFNPSLARGRGAWGQRCAELARALTTHRRPGAVARPRSQGMRTRHPGARRSPRRPASSRAGPGGDDPPDAEPADGELAPEPRRQETEGWPS